MDDLWACHAGAVPLQQLVSVFCLGLQIVSYIRGGRVSLIDAADILVGRLQQKRPWKVMMHSGMEHHPAKVEGC